MEKGFTHEIWWKMKKKKKMLHFNSYICAIFQTLKCTPDPINWALYLWLALAPLAPVPKNWNSSTKVGLLGNENKSPNLLIGEVFLSHALIIVSVQNSLRPVPRSETGKFSGGLTNFTEFPDHFMFMPVLTHCRTGNFFGSTLYVWNFAEGT